MTATEYPTRLGEATCTEVEGAAMAALRALFEERSYPQLYMAIGHGRVFADNLARAVADLTDLPPAEAFILSVFGLGSIGDEADADTTTRAVLDALEAAALCVRADGRVRTTGYIVVPVFGGLIMSGIPSSYAPSENLGALAYLGNDSLVLAGLIGSVAGRRVLDVGTGCGIQGILAARGCREAVLTDVDPYSLHLAALNVALNAVAHRVRIAKGDLLEPVSGEHFDLVVALPPYVPVDVDEGISVAAAGGADGLAFIRPLLTDIGDVLSPSGELVMLAQLLCDDDGPILARELDALCPDVDTRLVTVDHHPLQPYVGSLAQRLAAGGHDAASAYARLSATLRATGATSVSTSVIRARPRVIGSRAERRIIATRPVLDASLRVGIADDVTLQHAQIPVLRAASGAMQVLDPVTEALIASLGCEGDLAEAVARAWGSPADARPEDLVDQAIHRLTPLVEAGLLVVADERCAVYADVSK